jgi:hypothetical protein
MVAFVFSGPGSWRLLFLLAGWTDFWTAAFASLEFGCRRLYVKHSFDLVWPRLASRNLNQLPGTMRKSGGKGPPPKGQRSLTSFLFKTSSKEKPPATLEDPSASGDALKGSDSSARRTATEDDHQPPPKRPKPAAASAPADPGARHARWQAKIVGEDGGIVRERVRTQSGVAEQQAAGGQKLTPLEQQVERLQASHR